MTTDLVLTDVVVRYGKATALDGVSLTAHGGQITAVVGPNGAGKSSLLLAAYGSVDAEGVVVVGGDDLSAKSSTQRAQSGVAIVPQGRQTFPRLSVRENLQVMAESLRLSRRDASEAVERALDFFPRLRERSKQLAGLLSGGEQQMLAVSRALMGQPRVVLFDEMMTGLAPIIVQQLLATARGLADQGIVVVVAEPSIGAIADEIDRGFILIRGEIRATVEGGEALDAAYQEQLGVFV
jgi:branched-chain amino acid transport system ATP-binding protein